MWGEGELENRGRLQCGMMGGVWMQDEGGLSVSPSVGTSGLLAFAHVLRAQPSMLWAWEVLCKHPETPSR